ncbi:MAG: hypothetical protein K2P94_15865, partial [Rhodospirillaceae bacterium]|nr:hypothetical protein [Rhodospirillaceae bacterium]
MPTATARLSVTTGDGATASSLSYRSTIIFQSVASAVRARAYDLVLNGSEVAGGSIRIHDADLQRRIFSLLNITPEEAKLRFGLAFGAGVPLDQRKATPYCGYESYDFDVPTSTDGDSLAR